MMVTKAGLALYRVLVRLGAPEAEAAAAATWRPPVVDEPRDADALGRSLRTLTWLVALNLVLSAINLVLVYRLF